ncbi:MAG: hypothetical protein LKF87_03990 [Clostridium tyrobutyricum]|uniref:hypothetical protein n=1 Tax=Clostridium tyrobutyricum TaxID=1519 RepID=UPI00189E2427|nr:hypothetical protein [Clostridium tyrobutyricum]MCH4199235.1 hypothetical protein [Clostridium tyrobutyricum]MCH4236567.1 hypothetical protein [Clostridium tyrobutyricum]MCH4258117.1 hypothetical protein [Clostridium tyrobutyricum]MCI1239156.1 hypothetical protein [Clostridium tyrobutyricum]MCI1651372.1 hypothetical protein [Clostridium tyrobutyricum]
MPKTNKELAIDVVIAMINSNPKTVASNNSVSWGLGAKIENVNNAIKIISETLDSIDAKHSSN